MHISSQMAKQLASKKVRYKRLALIAPSWQLANMKTRIRELRQARGLTLEQLASMAGCSKSYMSELETGKKNISGRLLSSFAKQLGVSVYELIDSSDLSEDIVAHIAIMRDLSEEDRRAVARHALGLLEQSHEHSE